jgi:hypothetical protein
MEWTRILTYITGTVDQAAARGRQWSTKRYLSIELLKDQQMRGAITAQACAGRCSAPTQCAKHFRTLPIVDGDRHRWPDHNRPTSPA